MGPTQTRFLALIKEYGLETYLSPHGLGVISISYNNQTSYQVGTQSVDGAGASSPLVLGGSTQRLCCPSSEAPRIHLTSSRRRAPVGTA